MPPGLAGIFGGVAILVAFLFAASAIVPVGLAYVALRVRDSRADEPDPKLGTKTAYHLIHTISILMILTGLTISSADLMSGAISGKQPAQGQGQGGFGPGGRVQQQPAKEDGFNTAHRTASALVGVGTLFGLVFWMFLLSTNDDTHKAVRRVFVGGRMTLCLLITMGAVTVLTVVLVQKEPQDEVTEGAIAVLIVWLPAAILHMLLFQFNVTGSGGRRDRGRDRDDDDYRGWRPPT